MFYRPQINAQGEFTCFEPQIPIGPMPACQVPQFSTHVGFKNTIVKEGEEHPIIGVDQKADGFWLRIATNYNEYRGQLREKTLSQLKSRWHRINGFVQKFVGCYKQAVSGKKSGSSKKDIMIAAHAFYSQDTGGPFNDEYAWRLLKCEPKWMGASIECSSKRTKNSTSGAYSSSPNTETSYEIDSTSPMERPMGQKAAKRMGKAKAVETPLINTVVQDIMNKKVAALEKLAQLKEDEMEFKAMEVIMKDTSGMSESQLEVHEIYCNKLKKKVWILVKIMFSFYFFLNETSCKMTISVTLINKNFMFMKLIVVQTNH
ncbi:uncharacterized protein [Cicer arietinum]|uniref:uncharacterized protein n=1 Tax=Cicer arietinum TaxID=3827 RepID=UPI003CC624FB